jgi:ATP-dependent exoDNAse (exonuclease V) beta subunit
MRNYEERRRLFFVSATRARDELYITGVYKVAGNEKDGYQYNQFLLEAHQILGVPYDPVDHTAEKKTKKAKKDATAKVLKGQISIA